GIRLYGMTQTAYLDRIGVLGPDFTAAHAVWLDRDDMRRIADVGGAVAHNPGSNARLGAGLAAVRALLDAGVRVGIGTDACTCSDNLNMFEAMRVASMVSRVQEPDPERWLSTDEVLTLATKGSAGVLGFGGEIGAIEPGAKADIVFLDLGQINYVPLNDPVNQIVHGEDGTGVESVMIGGRMVLEERRMVTVNEAKLARDAEAAAARLAEVNAGARAAAERLEGPVRRFSVALTREDYHIERHARCTH
ncbi:MAG: amidohydrolase family protein, partial [Alphaproteobacteria bacterium]|nr:amidohydrolase family protein [Alphaproteobacteria bacterium]